MARHYGIRVIKSPAKDAEPAGALKGIPLIGAVVVLMIVLGVILYAVTKTVTNVANTTTSATDTTGQGAALIAPTRSRDTR